MTHESVSGPASDTDRLAAALRAEGLLHTDGQRMTRTVDVDVAHLAGLLRRHGLLTDVPGPAAMPVPTRPRAAGSRGLELHLSPSGAGHPLSLRRRDGQVLVTIDVEDSASYDLDEAELTFIMDGAAETKLSVGLLQGFADFEVHVRGRAGTLRVQLRRDGQAWLEVRLPDGNALHTRLDGNDVARLLVWLITHEVHPTTTIAAHIAPTLAGLHTPAGRVRDLLRAVRYVPPVNDAVHRYAYFDRVARHAANIGTYATGRLGGVLVLAHPGEDMHAVARRWQRNRDRSGGQ
ncbi:hypothetical protein [Cellulosimicrobium sp. NPDC057127]|uniref:hypothetical protein n=1 Tax=Cellulosimicrobium sp. NPDC057127 TaxID=3346026 RepID=UPI00362D10AE